MGKAVRRKVVGKVIRNLHRPTRPNLTEGPVSDSGGQSCYARRQQQRTNQT